MTTRERREARAARLRDWAEKREQRAAADYAGARQKSDVIPFGQPILVGHHSEGRDRRYRAGIDAQYRRAFESSDKAESMASRAATIESQLAASIYDDDPDALDRLVEKLARLEAERAAIVAFNRAVRKAKGVNDDALALLSDRQRREYAGLVELQARHPYTLREHGAFPSYTTSNIGGQISKLRDRIGRLRRQLRAR